MEKIEKRPRTQRPEGVDLAAAAKEHVRYEIRMLYEAAALFVDLTKPTSTTPWSEAAPWNAATESFAVHARNLHSFFFAGDEVIKDDTIAEDFMPDGVDWREKRGPISPALANVSASARVLRDIPRRAHKQIAHITYERLKVGPEGKQWPRAEICRAFAPLIRIWRASADPSIGIDSWAGDDLQQWPYVDHALPPWATDPSPVATGSSIQNTSLFILPAPGPVASSAPTAIGGPRPDFRIIKD